MSSMQIELIRALSARIEADEVNVLEDDRKAFASLAARFPVRSSGIRWERVKSHRCSFSPSPKPPAGENLARISEFLREFACAAGIADDQVLNIFGDQVTDIVMQMELHTLRECLSPIFSLPQSTFVTTQDFEWCFAYTFEDDLYYGRSPDQ